MDEVRCPRCRRKLAELQGKAEIVCVKCKALIGCDTEKNKIIVIAERR